MKKAYDPLSGPYPAPGYYNPAMVELVDDDPVDIVLDNLSESQEMSPGAVIPVGGTVPMVLHLPQGSAPSGAYTVFSISPWANNFRLYRTADKTSEVGLQALPDGSAGLIFPAGTSDQTFYVGAMPTEESVFSLASFQQNQYGQPTTRPADPAGGDQARNHTPANEVDLDIDSDNNNGFDPPGRTANEDAIEDEENLPGRIVGVNAGDCDKDGIPDYADGYTGSLGGAFTSGSGVKFVPMILELPEGTDLSKVKIKFHYSAAALDGPTRTGSGTKEDPYIYSPGPGKLRIWQTDGTRTERQTSDFIQSDTSYLVSDLQAAQIADNSRQFKFYVEAVCASATQGDQRIEVNVAPDGTHFVGGDAVRVTAKDRINLIVFEIPRGRGLIPITVPVSPDMQNAYDLLQNSRIGIAVIREIITSAGELDEYVDIRTGSGGVDHAIGNHVEIDPWCQVGINPDTGAVIMSTATGPGPNQVILGTYLDSLLLHELTHVRDSLHFDVSNTPPEQRYSDEVMDVRAINKEQEYRRERGYVTRYRYATTDAQKARARLLSLDETNWGMQLINPNTMPGYYPKKYLIV